MPTAAMERSMTEFSGFSSSSPTSSRAGRDQARLRRSQKQKEQDKEAEERKALVARAETMAKIAKNISDQQEKMLHGLETAARFANMGEDGEPLTKEPQGKTDFIARNRVNVGPDRDRIGRRERAMMAKAEVMASATAHLGGGGAAPAPRRRKPAEVDTTEGDDLVRAAMEEMQRGDQLSAIEAQTRRPAHMRLMGSGRSGGQSMRGRGRGGRGGRGRR